MADHIKPDLDAVKARIAEFRQEQIAKVTNLAPDTKATFKEIAILSGLSDIRKHHVALTALELLDDLLLAIGENGNA